MQHIILYPNFIIDAYEKPHADLLDSQPHEFPARWNEMYGSLKIAHHAILLIGGTFIA
ncbi:hypothetical protein EVJ58_g8709 [Rhodofomes roseus]|nr:hypothetical protein EVJ58_g8709 [Rhodofomes roseus]